jgi:hypothetical protein
MSAVIVGLLCGFVAVALQDPDLLSQQLRAIKAHIDRRNRH